MLQVRTARVMLATDPSKAAEEVAHELMHAAHTGMTWPDEGLIGLALQSEVRRWRGCFVEGPILLSPLFSCSYCSLVLSQRFVLQ